MMKKHPTELADLCKKHDLDMLCLQETKLQEILLDDPRLKLRGYLSDAGYDEYWSCSTAKKGYSGTAVFVKHEGMNCRARLSNPMGVRANRAYAELVGSYEYLHGH
jgi:exonuclease III